MPKKKIHIDETLLRKKFVEDLLPIWELVKIFNCGENRIWREVKKLKLTRRRPYFNSSIPLDALKHLYAVEKKDAGELAKIFGVSKPTIYSRLESIGVPRRQRIASDFSGYEFGFISVINSVGSGTIDMQWNCVCKLCNKEVLISHRRLQHGTLTHCGCRPFSEGCGELSLSQFNRIRQDAKDKNREFTLIIEEVWELFVKQNRKCAISGVKLDLLQKRRSSLIRTASLDRIDSKKGYHLDNVQWVHKDLNFMKQEYSQKEFIEWCRIVAANNPK